MLLHSRFLTLSSYSYRMHIHTRQLILMQVFFVIVKRYCLKQCRRYGKAVLPLTTACAPPFWFTQNTFSEHHVTTRLQATMEKGIITFTLTLARSFLHSLQNCWPPSAVHKCEAIICLIYPPLRMYRGIGV